MAQYLALLLTRTGAMGPHLKVIPEYERGLGNTGRCEFEVNLNHQGLTEAATEPWANEVLLLRRDDISDTWDVAFDGPITESDWDADRGTVEIVAEPVSEWLGKRWQRRSIGYTRQNADLDTIANDIIFLAQHPEPPFAYSARADFKTAQSFHASGVLRNLQIASTARVNWLEKLRELATGNPGFDWDIETTWNATTLTRTRTFRTWSPSRGTLVATKLLQGHGLIGLGEARRGVRAANYVESIGAGGTALVSDAKQDGTNQDTYGLLELLDSASDISSKARLNDRATEQLRIRKPPTAIPRFGYAVGPGLPWRFVDLGDRLTVQGSAGAFSVNGTFRIVGEKVGVTKGGMERVMLTAQDPLA